MVSEAEIGVVLVGIPILHAIETNENIDWVRILAFTIMTVGGLKLISDSSTVDLKKTPSEILGRFDGIFDELEELSWKPLITMNG